jgi:hypothetical protein
MLHKQQLLQIAIDRTHVLLGAATMIVSPSKWAASLKNALNSSIPEGYQDESGFHFGAKAPVEENR